MASERGRARAENQDAAFVARDGGLLIVSDGMGGHRGGSVAARLVGGLLPALLERVGAATPGYAVDAGVTRGVIRRAVLAVNAEVRARGAHNPDLQGLGATIALVLLGAASAHVANLGDSRVYLLRGPGLRRLTVDHTLAAALSPLAPGSSGGTPGGAPSRHRLARCLGMEGDATPDVRTVELQAGDRLLLCTDGVTGALPDRLIAHLLRHQGSPDEACRVLTGAAGRAGGQDDATAVVAFVDALPELPAGPAGPGVAGAGGV
ncbi:MAG TPA: protein phosphatase 2C domain-containing protein [Chloroflexota bacterium]|nr:protein phosphatase 2C domain-containing protein [Chloroflexota bacterium]